MEDRIFTENPVDENMAQEKEVAQRSHAAYQERTQGLVGFIIKSGPGMLMRFMLILILTSSFSTFLGAKYSERFASISADLIQGNFIAAFGTLGTFLKGPTIEFTYVSSGKNPYLSDNGLNEFAYIGTDDGISYAVMENVYSTQHHDPELKPESGSYNNPIRSMSVSEAIDLCQEKYGNHNGDLISYPEWEKSQSNFLGRNQFTIPKEPEWTRTPHEDDGDDYKVIAKFFDVAKYVEDEGIDNEEDGQYVDGDDSDKFLFRCSINWPVSK